MKRNATQEEVNIFNNFIKENKFIVRAEPVTTYPDGIAKTTVIINLEVEVEKTEDKQV